MEPDASPGGSDDATAALKRGAWFGLFTQGVDKILPVLIILYLARTLPAEEFGAYAFLTAYLALFQIIAEQSLDTVLVRMLSRDAEHRVELVHAALGLRMISAIVAALAATILVVPVSGGRIGVEITALASLGLVTAMGGIYRAVYRADLHIRGVFLIALARAVFLALGVIVAIAVRPGLHALFAAMAAANLLSFAVVAVVSSRRTPFGVSYSRRAWRELARGAYPLALNALAITVTLRAGQIILMSMRGPVEVGFLGAASRVGEAFMLLPEALMITVYPIMAGLHGSDAGRLVATAEKSTRYLVMITGVPVVVCLVAGAEIMSLLFGESFAAAGTALSVLASMALVGATGTVILNLLVAVHEERTLYRNTSVFAVINVLVCFPFISRWGFMGAAVAMLATSAAAQLRLAWLPSTATLVRPCLAQALRSVAAVAVGAVVGVASGLAPLPACALAVVTYLAALALLGVLNREEVRFVRSTFAALSTGGRGR